MFQIDMYNYILIFLVSASQAKVFTIPDECNHLNKEGYQTADLTWNCYVNVKDNMSCWFNLEKIFQRVFQPGIVLPISIYYQCGLRYYTFNRTQTDRCLTFRDIMCEPGFTIINISTQFFEDSVPSLRFIHFNNRQYVIPMTVQKIDIHEPVNTTSLSLQWELPLSHRQREIRVRFQSEYSNEIQNSWQEITRLSENDDVWSKIFKNDLSCNDCQITLINLTAFTLYDIKVDNIFVQNAERVGFWSDSIELRLKTAEDVPTAVPKLFPGYFLPVNDSHLKIYWNPIPAERRCGIITNYRIKVTEIRNMSKDHRQTILVPPEYFFAVISANAHSNLSISLTQRTIKGYPDVKDACMVVLSEATRPSHPENFFVEAINNNTIVYSWEQPYVYTEQKVSSFTIYWCYSNPPGVCSTPLQSLTLSQTSESTLRNNTTITVSGHYTLFDFGVSVEVETGDNIITSSGIKWFRDCVYELNGAPQKIPVFEIYPSGANEVFLSWNSYTCQESGGVVDAFLVKYCTIVKNVCQDTMVITVSLTMHSYLIRGLSEGQNYSIQIGFHYKYGHSRGLWSKPAFYIVPETENSNFTQIAVITVLSLICVLAVYIWCKRKCSAKLSKKPSIDFIEVTKISSIPNEEHMPKPGLTDSGLGKSSCEVYTRPKEDDNFKSKLIDECVNSDSENSFISIKQDDYSEVEQLYSDSEIEDEWSTNKESQSNALSFSENKINASEDEMSRHNCICFTDMTTSNAQTTSISTGSLSLSSPEKSDNCGTITSYCRATENIKFEDMPLISQTSTTIL